MEEDKPSVHKRSIEDAPISLQVNQVQEHVGTPPEACSFPACDHVQRVKEEWLYTADALPQIVCLVDRAGVVIRCNRTIERWGLGDVEDAVGKSLHALLHPACNGSHCELNGFLAAHLRQLADGTEVKYQSEDAILGRHLDVQLCAHSHSRPASPLEQAGFAVAVVTDISDLKKTELELQNLAQNLEKRVELRTAQLVEANSQLYQEVQVRQQAEAALRVSRDNYQRLVDTMSEGLAIRDMNDRISYVNDCMARMLGYEPEELLGRQVLELLADTSPESWASRTAQRRSGDVTPYVLAFKGRSGRLLWAKVSPRPLFDANGEYSGSFAVVTDMTERVQIEMTLRKSEEELRQLSAQVLSAQEKERKRIAAELHDGIGQTLSAIKFSVESTVRQLRDHIPEQDLSLLQNVIPKMQGAIEEVRQISMDLRPSILDDLGIVATLSWFCREYRSDFQGLEVVLEAAIYEEDVPAELKVVIFRIVQEALNNVAKHASAHRVGLKLRNDGQALELEIVDDGVGFELDDARAKRSHVGGGMGLISMRERAEYSGGQFQINSVPGQGTRIGISWPQAAVPPDTAN